MGLVLILVCVCYFAVAWWWVRVFGAMVISREATSQAGVNNLHQLWLFWIGSGLMWGVLTILYLVVRKRGDSFSSSRFWGVIVFILLTGMVLRVGVVMMHQPGLSDDIWRYVFDGEVMASGHNPYEVSPGEVERDHERFIGEYALANRVNNPELATIYLPVSQVIFAMSAKMAQVMSGKDIDVDGGEMMGRVDPDWEAEVFRFVFVGFEMGVMVLLAFVLFTMKKSAWYLALYVWHPLAISEIAGEGHQDVIGLFFMVGALLVWELRKRWVGRWSFLLAISALVKPMSVVVAGFQLRYDRAKRWDWVKSLLVGGVVCGLLMTAFFFLSDTTAWIRFTETVSLFVHKWAFFGSVYTPLMKLTGSEVWARRILAVLLGLVVLVMMLKRREPWRASRDFFFAGVLLSTTVWPWYLLWALVLFPVRQSASLWVATLTIPWGYAVLGDVVGWTVPGWLPWLSYGPVYVILLLEMYYYLRRDHTRATTDE